MVITVQQNTTQSPDCAQTFDMANSKKVDFEWMMATFMRVRERAKTALEVKEVIVMCAGVMDGGASAFMDQVANKVVGWLANRLGLGKFIQESILASIIALEYFRRTGNADRATSLKNKCGVCRCKGHNKQNCAGNAKWVQFVKQFSEDAADQAVDSLSDSLDIDASSTCTIN